MTYEEYLKLQANRDLESWSHLVTVTRNRLIYGLKEPQAGRGGASFVNDGYNVMNPPNVTLDPIPSTNNPPLPREREVYLRAKRPIRKGEELFADYKSAYWRRFLDTLPEVYDEVFSRQIRRVGRLRKLLDQCDSGRLQRLVNALEKTPVPRWPELKGSVRSWTVYLCRYALFRLKVADERVLNLGAIRLLKQENDAYFEALGKHVCRRTADGKNCSKKDGAARNIAADWNRITSERHRTGVPLAAIPIPANGVFKEGVGEWMTSHISVFYHFYRPVNFCIDAKRLMHVLHVLDPSHEFYRELIKTYIFRHFIPEEKVVDFNIEKLRKKKEVVLCALGQAALVVPIGFEGEGKRWNADLFRKFLVHEGYTIIDNVPSRHIWQTLDNVFDQDDSAYNPVFLKICRRRKCDFAILAATAKVSYKKFGVRFKPVTGLSYDKIYCNKHALFMQYIHRAGFDCREVYKRASNETLYKCLKMIQEKYQTPLSSNLAYDFLAIAIARIKNPAAANRVLRDVDVPHLNIPVGTMRNERQVYFEQLRTHGDNLRAQYEKLPYLALVSDSV